MRVKLEWNKSTKSKFTDLSKKGQELLDSEVLKSSNKYVPKDEQYLERSSIASTIFGSGQIIWNTPYARRLYYNPQYNFSKDINANAQGLWYEAAKASHLKEWEYALEQLKNKTI